MADTQKNNSQNDVIFSWFIDEYEKKERGITWYIIAIITAFLLLLFAFFSSNFLFAMIVVIVALVTILHDGKEPQKVKVSITREGIAVGRKFIDYDEMKNFSVIYKPRIDVKNIYIEFKNILRHRMTIPLENKDPIKIREVLLKYLPEDLERTDEPASESIAKLLKL